jgi:hypothetical protein
MHTRLLPPLERRTPALAFIRALPGRLSKDEIGPV